MDDERRKLKVAATANPSLRSLARPKVVQSNPAVSIRRDNSVRITPANNEGTRVRIQQPQSIRQAATPKKLSVAGVQQPRARRVAPQQSFGNKIRDIFDENTAADQYRRDVQFRPKEASKDTRSTFQRFSDFVEDSNRTVLGGLGRATLRTGNLLVPGDIADENKINRIFPVSERQGSTGTLVGNIQKGLVDVASLAIPAAQVSSAVAKTGAISNAPRFVRFAAPELAGGAAATGVEAVQTSGRGDQQNLVESALIGAAADLTVPVLLKPVSKLIRWFKGVEPPTSTIDDISEYFVRETDPNAVKAVLDTLGVSGSQADNLAVSIARSTDSTEIGRAIDAAVPTQAAPPTQAQPQQIQAPEQLQNLSTRVDELDQAIADANQAGDVQRVADLQVEKEAALNELTDTVNNDSIDEAANLNAGVSDTPITEADTAISAGVADDQVQISQEVSDAAAQVARAAEEVNPEFQNSLARAARDLNIEAINAPVKGVKRLAEKATFDYGGDLTQIKDAVRGTLLVTDPRNLNDIIAVLEQNFQINRIKNGFDLPGGGYKDIKVNVQLPNGMTGEIIVAPPEMIKAKEVLHGHALYEEARVAVDTGRLRELENQMNELYNNATEAMNQRLAMTGDNARRLYDDAATSVKNFFASLSDTSVPSTTALAGGNGAPVATTVPRVTPSVSSSLTTDSSTIKNLATSDPSTNIVAKQQREALGALDVEKAKGTVARGFQNNLAQDANTPIAVWEDIFGYKPVTNESQVASAAKRVANDEANVLNDILTKDQLSADDLAAAQILLRRFVDNDDLGAAQQIAQRISQGGTDAGRQVQILAAYRKTTPEGALREAFKIVDEANQRFGGKGRTYGITNEQKDKIIELAEAAQREAPGTRERQVAEALLAKEVTEVVPPTIGQKIAATQTMAQLLNFKTAIRNVGGNAILSALETANRFVAAPIDRLVSLNTKQRTIAIPRIMSKLGGSIKGAKEGYEDVLLGIRTTGEGGKFDIQSSVFRGKVGRQAEKLLGFELQVADKAFYMGQFEETLDSIMRAQGVDKPTAEMLQIANEEALYATFQNNGALANTLKNVKRGLNFGKDFGVGDLVLKYPKTPGNIVSVGLDYSPFGFMKSLYQFTKGVDGLSAAQQREAILNLSRSLTGTGLIVGGYYLAKNNIITANPSKDADVRNLERNESVGAYRFNLSALRRLLNGEDTTAQEGDIVSNYDWAQPTAIQLSMGASMAASNKESEDALRAFIDSASAGVDTITEQPVVRSVTDFISTTARGADQGGGLVNAAIDAVADAPSSFNPSISRQIAQATDNTVRETRDPNPFVESINRVKAGVPVLSTSLPAKVDTFGEDIKRFQGDNAGKRGFDVFLNPAFVDKLNRSPEGQLVLDIYNRTGETSQFPNTVKRKYTINGESRSLTGREMSDLQRYVGKKTAEAFRNLAGNKSFQALSDEQKADKMADVISDIGKAGRIEVLGNEPKTVESDVKKILNNRLGEFSSRIPEGVEGAASKYYERIAYLDDDSLNEYLTGAPDDVAQSVARELNSDRPDGIGEIVANNQISKLYATYKKSEAESNWSDVERVNKRENLWKNIVKQSATAEAQEVYGIASGSINELREFLSQGLITDDSLRAAIELDNALYRSGLNRSLQFNEKFRREFGYAIPDTVESVKAKRTSSGTRKSSGGGGSRKTTRTLPGTFKLRFNPKTPPLPSTRVNPGRVKFKVEAPRAIKQQPIKLEL